MSMTIDENTLGIWYVTMPNGDWMGSVQACDGGGCVIRYRFRYYKDDRAFDSDDVKSWYEAEGPNAAHGIDALRKLAQAIKATKRGELWELLRGAGSAQDLMQELMKLPFVHYKRVPMQ